MKIALPAYVYRAINNFACEWGNIKLLAYYGIFIGPGPILIDVFAYMFCQ